MKVNYEMISIQNSCIPQGLSSNWDKLYNVQLIQKGLALRKVFIISKGTCKLQSVQQMYEIFPKTISWTFLLLKVKVSCQGDNGNVFQLKHSFLSIVWKDFNREEKSSQMHITLPSLPRKHFQGRSYFFPPHKNHKLVGREQIRSPLKTPAGEATHCPGSKISRFQQTIIQQIWQEKK